MRQVEVAAGLECRRGERGVAGEPVRVVAGGDQ
jgi:hypothetical protein